MRGPAGVDDKVQIAVKARHHKVVENTAIGVEEHRIPDPAFADPGDIGRGQRLEHRIAVGARQLDLRHVRDVEKACRGASRKVLGLDTVRILNRHVPSGKRHHTGAVGEVEFVKRCPAGLHGVTPVTTQIKRSSIMSNAPSLSSNLRDFPLRSCARQHRRHDLTAAFPVGGHCRAAFQSAHKKEYRYLRVSWAFAPSVAAAGMPLRHSPPFCIERGDVKRDLPPVQADWCYRATAPFLPCDR